MINTYPDQKDISQVAKELRFTVQALHEFDELHHEIVLRYHGYITALKWVLGHHVESDDADNELLSENLPSEINNPEILKKIVKEQ